MSEIPSVFQHFFEESPVVQEFISEEAWGQRLRTRLTETDPHWKIVGWKEYPERSAVAAVTASHAGTDLHVFLRNGPKNTKNLQYWSVDDFYNDNYPIRRYTGTF